MERETEVPEVPDLSRITSELMYTILQLGLTLEQFLETLECLPVQFRDKRNGYRALYSYLYVRQASIPTLNGREINVLYSDSKFSKQVSPEKCIIFSHAEAIAICKLPIELGDILDCIQYLSLNEIIEVSRMTIWESVDFDLITYSKLRHKGNSRKDITDWLHDGFDLDDLMELSQLDALVHIDDMKRYCGSRGIEDCTLSEMANLWVRARSIDIKEKTILDMLRDEFDIAQYLELRIEADLSHDAAIKVLEDPELLEVFRSMK